MCSIIWGMCGGRWGEIIDLRLIYSPFHHLISNKFTINYTGTLSSDYLPTEKNFTGNFKIAKRTDTYKEFSYIEFYTKQKMLTNFLNRLPYYIWKKAARMAVG